MSVPIYVSPEQWTKDKADYARKGIARGRPLVVLEYTDGIVLVTENPSSHLHKLSELYDRIAFAAVGRFSEFENLRVAGVRIADIRGYTYGREDVTGRAIANACPRRIDVSLPRSPGDAATATSARNAAFGRVHVPGVPKTVSSAARLAMPSRVRSSASTA